MLNPDREAAKQFSPERVVCKGTIPSKLCGLAINSNGMASQQYGALA